MFEFGKRENYGGTNRDKGTLDFEDQLREIDAEISGNDDKGCNMENVLTEIMEKENKLTAKRNETLVGEALTHGPEEIEGLDEPKAPLSQVKDLQLFQIGPNELATCTCN